MNPIEQRRKLDYEAFAEYERIQLRDSFVKHSGDFALNVVMVGLGPVFETPEVASYRDAREMSEKTTNTLGETALLSAMRTQPNEAIAFAQRTDYAQAA